MYKGRPKFSFFIQEKFLQRPGFRESCFLQSVHKTSLKLSVYGQQTDVKKKLHITQHLFNQKFLLLASKLLERFPRNKSRKTAPKSENIRKMVGAWLGTTGFFFRTRLQFKLRVIATATDNVTAYCRCNVVRVLLCEKNTQYAENCGSLVLICLENMEIKCLWIVLLLVKWNDVVGLDSKEFQKSCKSIV